MNISIEPNPVKPGTYRVMLQARRAADFEAFLRFAQDSSTVSRADASAVVELLAQWIAARAEGGQEVLLGPLGRSRLGMKGQFTSIPDRIDDKDVELTISWILPRKLKRRVALAGNRLVRKRVAPQSKSPLITAVRLIESGGQPVTAVARYLPGRGLRIDGRRLDYDTTQADEGVFLIDPQQNETRVELVALAAPSKILLIMPADAAGSYTLEVRRRHPKSTGRLLRGRYGKTLEPEA